MGECIVSIVRSGRDIKYLSVFGTLGTGVDVDVVEYC